MRGLRKTRRIQVIVVCATALAGATVLTAYGLRDGINFFRSPSQVAQLPPPPSEVFRIGGMVEEGSLRYGQAGRVNFRVTDGAASVAVRYTGILPDLFGEGEGMVALGRYVDQTFHASEILARHDETYMPAELSDSLPPRRRPDDTGDIRVPWCLGALQPDPKAHGLGRGPVAPPVMHSTSVRRGDVEDAPWMTPRGGAPPGAAIRTTP